MPHTHELQCWMPYFVAMLAGDKTFELRKHDRHFDVGDILLLREWHAIRKAYTGRVLRAQVTYILHGDWPGLMPGYILMSLRVCGVPEEGEPCLTPRDA